MPTDATEDQLFTKQDYNLLRTHWRKMNDLLTTIDKAEQCGVACDFIRAQREATVKQLEMIQQHFMTPPPKK